MAIIFSVKLWFFLAQIFSKLPLIWEGHFPPLFLACNNYFRGIFSGKKKIEKQGRRFPAKIYGYVDNTSYTVNNSYTVNVKVHYFDERHVEREAILPTGFPQGSGMYPIGMTIDIFEYQGKFSYDPNSVRNEVLPGEDELMDDKPVAPDKLQLVAVTCPNCGSNFQAATGYSSKCPYCGGYINV